MLSKQPEQKNLLLAIVLSMGVLFLWQYFYAGPKFQDEQERLKRSQQQSSQQVPGTKAAPGAPGQTSVLPGAPAAPGVPGVPGVAASQGVPSSPATREAALAISPRVAIETSSLIGSIALKGGRIDDLKLVKFHETVDKTSPAVTLFSPSTAPNPYYAEFGWVPSSQGGKPIKRPDSDTVWKPLTKGPLTPSSPVTLSWDNGEGLQFQRTIKLDENYMFSVTDSVENKTAQPVTMYPYALISRHGTPKTEGIYILHEGLIGVAGDSGLLELPYSTLVGEIDKSAKAKSANLTAVRDYKGKSSGWFGITDKYWAAVLVPQQNVEYDARMWAWRSDNKDHYQVDYRKPGVTIQPGAKGTAETRLFAGAKDVNIIDGYKAQFDIKQFDSLIDWGTFWYITKPLFWLLDYINRIVGNFGTSILIVTVLVKLLFFPLANKSYESMAKMKKLQPEMERLRDRYKDDKAAQQKELMALYQKEKINPLAGCLPILVQIPVFFALYKVLFVSLDMRHAPFIGWIKDLSAPDPTSFTNLFGLLPFAPLDQPLLGYSIGAWAIVMGFTMWLQMQLNPAQPDPVQQQIFNWMPVMFTFLLGGFASGLVIYWTWSNILSIAQQWYIMKKNKVDVPLLDNIKKTLQPALAMAGVGRRADSSPPVTPLKPAKHDAPGTKSNDGKSQDKPSGDDAKT